MHTRILGVVAVATAAFACGAGEAETGFDTQAVAREVEAAVSEFRDAQRSLDPDRILSFIAPEFFMYSDGVRQDYEATAAAIRSQMPAFRFFEPTWTDTEVTVLGPDGAVTSLLFRDSIIDAEGNLLQLRGPFTAAWRRFGTDWRIVYADADHYPVQNADAAP